MLRSCFSAFASGLLIFANIGCGPTDPPPPRVLVLGIDGLDADVVDLLIGEGRMPNFAAMRATGASGVLRSDPPMLSPILWTTMATGRTPDEHGIGDFATADSADGSKQPVTSSLRRVPALWNIASDAGRRVGVVGWWATWPPEAVNGVMVSDHACFHFLFGEGQSGAARTENAIYPPERAREFEALIRRPDDITATEVERFLSIDEDELNRPFDFTDDVSHFKWALATAESYRAIGRRLWEQDEPELLMVYIEGTDSVSHLFGHLFRAEDLAGDLAEQQRRYGRAVEEMYLWADEMVGEFMGLMDDRTSLVVLSDHGFKLGKLHDDPTITTSMRRVSDAFHDLDGVLFMTGPNVRAGAAFDDARQADIAPTVLELLGLPASREMNGRVLSEALTVEPLPRVAAYDQNLASTRAGDGDENVRREVLAHLEALGYLDTEASEGGISRSQADLLLSEGRSEEAAEAFSALIETDPSNATLHLNLAVALMDLDRLDEALEALERAEELDPLDAKVFVNRGVIEERKGDKQAAVESYRTALRYDPHEEIARKGLDRLTGSSLVYDPKNEQEREAVVIAAKASEKARQGDYEAAARMLDRAEALAPELPVIHQYRANVAYLSGDVEGAIAALERSLELEPDNAMVRKNLGVLRKRLAESP